MGGEASNAPNLKHICRRQKRPQRSSGSVALCPGTEAQRDHCPQAVPFVFVTGLPFQDVDMGGRGGPGDPPLLPSAAEREVILPGFTSDSAPFLLGDLEQVSEHLSSTCPSVQCCNNKFLTRSL